MTDDAGEYVPIKEVTAITAPPAYEIVEFDTREQWLAARRMLITGTDAAAILGLHPSRTAFNVYMNKTGEEPALDESLWYLQRGRALEPALANDFCRRTGKIALVPWKQPFGILISRQYPWLAHTIDRAVIDRSDPKLGVSIAFDQFAGDVDGWEGKTARGTLRHRWGDHEIPDEHYMQNTIGLIVTRFERWWLTAAIGDDEPRDYMTPPPDEKFEGSIMERLDDFMRRHIRGGEAPAVDASDAARNWLRLRHPKNLGNYIRVAGDAEQLVMAYRAANETIAKLEESKAEIQNRIIALIGDNDGVEGDWGRVHYKLTRQKVDWHAVAVELQMDVGLLLAALKVYSDTDELITDQSVQTLMATLNERTLTNRAEEHRPPAQRQLNPKFAKGRDE